MSRLQEAAKPYLLELHAGRWPSWDEASTRAVAAWAAMVTMNIEFADLDTLATTPEERSAFKASLTPGDNWQIHVGLCHGGLDPGSFWHRAPHIKLEEGENKKPEKPNTQTTTFYLGRSFFHVLSAPAAISPDPQSYANHLGVRQLWPKPDAPPAQPLIFTAAGVSRVATDYWTSFGLSPEPHGGMSLV